MKYVVIFSILFLPAVAGMNIYPQESATVDTLKIDEVVITGTKVAVTRSNVPLTVSVIRKEEIEESAESALLPVLSERIPGIFVTKRGITGFGVATGSAGQISIRGIGGSPNTQVLVLLNGNPQYMGIMGHPLADAYVASDVERVEVIRGPASILYGTNSMGGVINIITKEQAKQGFSCNSKVLYGSYNTLKLMANGGFNSNNFNIFAGVNYDHTDGHRDSSDFSILNSYVQTGYRIGNHYKVRADFSLAQFKATDPGPVNGSAGESIDIIRGMGAFSFDNHFRKYSGAVRFFYNFGDHTITDGFHSFDINYGWTVYEALNLFNGNTITFGFDYKKYGGFAENTLAMGGEGIEFIDTILFELAGYTLIQQELFNKLVFNAGFRLDYNNVVGYEPVPSVGFAYNAAKYTSIKGSVSKGFRYPTIRELYMWAPANNNLKPERMINYEAGIFQRLLKDRLTGELTVFYSNGDNLIKTQMQGGIPQYRNTGDFSNWGIELSGSVKLWEKLNFKINYSYIDMREPVLATPEHQLFINGTYSWKRFIVNLSAQSVINLYLQSDPDIESETYTLLNSRIMFRINKHLELFFKAENLLNVRYEINKDYPMPGFLGFIGLNVHF